MSHASYSYLDPSTLELALDLARRLSEASTTVADLTGGASGRMADKAIAVREWVGPHRDTFELLFENEMSSAGLAESRLEDEADDWARFWAMAMNARNDRLYDEATNAYNIGMSAYRDRLQSYHDAIEEQPDLITMLSAPSPPVAPTRAPLVVAPTAATGYRP